MLEVVTKERHQKIQRMLALRQPDLTVLAEQVHKPHNLSAILRSADAVGIPTVHAVNPTGGVPTYNETSASADKWVELKVHKSLSAVRASLPGTQFFAAHFSADAKDYRDVDYTRPTCILLGNEKRGVSDEAAAFADAHIIIPMLGMVQSLNVSVAAAVILFEAQRQRLAAGRYQPPRLAEGERQKRTFRYLHPRRAALLDARGQPYPLLDEDGDIVNSHETASAQLEPRHDAAGSRYELVLDGEVIGHLAYQAINNDIFITHTEIAPNLRGRALAATLTRFALEDIRAQGKKVIPQCPYTRSYIKRHPEFAPLAATER